VEAGKYVIIDPEELEQTVPESSRVIEVHEFVKTGQIDPLFLDRVYNLEPDFQGPGYSTLVKALKDMGVAGICTWTMRKRSYLGALQANGTVLRLNTLRHADEVVPTASLGLQEAPLSEKELKIGSDLINQMTASFEPRKFENEHQKKLQEMIAKKARGEKIAVLAPRRLKPTESDELLEVLEASLKKVA
jgi:DNA end-binding protein Ku